MNPHTIEPHEGERKFIKGVLHVRRFRRVAGHILATRDGKPLSEWVPEKLDADVEATWKGFWEPLLTIGKKLDLNQLKKELHDYQTLIQSVSKVYDHVTGGHISKPNTSPEAVKGAFDEHLRQCVKDALEDEEPKVLARALVEATENAGFTDTLVERAKALLEDIEEE